MATYYVELDGGTITPKVQLEGAQIYPTGGGSANLETKSVSYTPSETAISDTLTPSTGYDGFDQVNVSVGAIPDDYVGSAITQRDDTDLYASVADSNLLRFNSVTAPAGYYENDATISPAFSEVVMGNPSFNINNDGSVDIGMSPTSRGFAYQSQTYSATKNNAVTVKSAQTYTPTTTNQTISANQYLTGAQTILGDADLVAGNIKKDVTIFGVVGTYEGGGGGGSAITVTDTIDPVSGGTIREITGVDISNDTVTADKLAYGYTAHMADGTAITGTRRFWVEQTIATDGAVTQALDPYTLYHFTGNLTSLTITLNTPSAGVIAHYHFDFLSGSTAPTLTMPNTVTMPDSFAVEASKRYEVDVLNNFGTVVTWAN